LLILTYINDANLHYYHNDTLVKLYFKYLKMIVVHAFGINE